MYQLKQRFDFSTITCSAISTFLYRLSCLPACSTGLPPFLFPLLSTTKILLLLTFFVVVPDYNNFLRSHSYYQSHSHHKPYFILKLCFLPSFFLSVYAIINIIFKFTLSLWVSKCVWERTTFTCVLSCRPVLLSYFSPWRKLHADSSNSNKKEVRLFFLLLSAAITHYITHL